MVKVTYEAEYVLPTINGGRCAVLKDGTYVLVPTDAIVTQRRNASSSGEKRNAKHR